jgi:GNAT superfamily N-acetyltransferase
LQNNDINIIDLSEEYLQTYFCCLEDWSVLAKEAGSHKERWYKANKDKGLRVKLARVDDKICGMIQYIPAEKSTIIGKDIYFIMCIWVHGHKEGIGNYQKQGIGTALIYAAEKDVMAMGKKGIAAWGLAIPVWMKASWYKKHGYVKADRDGIAVMMWKKFRDDAEKPSFIRRKKHPECGGKKVNVQCFLNGWCPSMNTIYERTRRASLELGDKVEFHTIDTMDRNIFNEWGISDAVYIDGKHMWTGPPPPYEKIKKKIEKKIRKHDKSKTGTFSINDFM